jgi:hypothetical protein
MNLSALQTTLISFVGAVCSIAFAFGVFSNTTEQVVISSAGVLIGIGFSLWTELQAGTAVKAAIAAGDQPTLRLLAKR